LKNTRPALPALPLAVPDGDPSLRRAAAEALRKVEVAGVRVVTRTSGDQRA